MEFLKECQLNRFLKSQQMDLIMFAHVQCLKINMPTVQRRDAIRQFMTFYNIEGDIGILETTYNRMMKKLMDADKG
jgi:hypothetical protein